MPRLYRVKNLIKGINYPGKDQRTTLLSNRKVEYFCKKATPRSQSENIIRSSEYELGGEEPDRINQEKEHQQKQK